MADYKTKDGGRDRARMPADQDCDVRRLTGDHDRGFANSPGLHCSIRQVVTLIPCGPSRGETGRHRRFTTTVPASWATIARRPDRPGEPRCKALPQTPCRHRRDRCRRLLAPKPMGADETQTWRLRHQPDRAATVVCPVVDAAISGWRCLSIRRVLHGFP
jgi:hypothetical protein